MKCLSKFTSRKFLFSVAGFAAGTIGLFTLDKVNFTEWALFTCTLAGIHNYSNVKEKKLGIENGAENGS